MGGGSKKINPSHPARGRSQLPLPKLSTSALQATYLLQPQFPHLRRTCPPVPPPSGRCHCFRPEWAAPRGCDLGQPDPPGPPSTCRRAPSRTWPGAQVCRVPQARRRGAALKGGSGTSAAASRRVRLQTQSCSKASVQTCAFGGAPTPQPSTTGKPHQNTLEINHKVSQLPALPPSGDPGPHAGPDSRGTSGRRPPLQAQFPHL